MDESTAISRRDIRGYATAMELQATPVETSVPEKRSSNLFDSTLLAAMDQVMPQASIDDLATLLTANVDPGNPDLKQQAAIYLTQLNSALLAVSICNSGFELAMLCQQSEIPDVRYRLGMGGYNAEQVSNIVCFCSVYGLPLNANNDEVRMQLTSSIYALQSASEPGADLSQLCDTVSIPYGPALQIDNSGIKSYVCTNGTSTASAFAFGPPMVTASSGTAVSVGTISSFISGESGVWANSTSWTLVATGTGIGFGQTTGEAGTWSNSSTWAQLGTGTGTGFSLASGEPGPWANSTGGGNGSWSGASNTITASGAAGATGSFSTGWGSTETGILGTGSQEASRGGGATATGGSWSSSGAGETITTTAGGSWVPLASWTATNGALGTAWSWTGTGGATTVVTGWGWNATAAAAPTGGSWTATGLALGTAWSVTGSDGATGVITALGWDATAATTATGGSWTAAGGAWGASGSWTVSEGATGVATGWGFNGTAAAGPTGGVSTVTTEFNETAATAGPTGGVSTVTTASSGEATGWGFNASFAGGPGPATGGWGTGSAWTATGGTWQTGTPWTVTGGSWGTGVAGTGSNATFTFALGTGTFKTIAGTGTASDLWSIVIENATTITVQNETHMPLGPTAPISYASWTTSTTSESVLPEK